MRIAQDTGNGALDMRGMRNLVKALPQYRYLLFFAPPPLPGLNEG